MTDLAARVEAARQRWNAGDLPGYLSLYDAGIKLHGYTPEPMSKAAVTGFYEMIFATMAAEGKPNPVLEFSDVLTDGESLLLPLHHERHPQGPIPRCPADQQALRVARHHNHAFQGRQGDRALVVRGHARRAGADRRGAAAGLTYST